ncbi:MAG: hypothetical protein BMS9Abin21_169 [Thermodesulfovibrionia bacterium]|nr:MAG: hypothetical protein BMS9Abin21_169 [Thermodesulfovibrionia bacterium]
MHGGYLGGMGLGGFGSGWIFTILLWALAIAGITYLVKIIARSNTGKVRIETAVDILNKRFASGEISKKKFDEKMKVLVKRNMG